MRTLKPVQASQSTRATHSARARVSTRSGALIALTVAGALAFTGCASGDAQGADKAGDDSNKVTLVTHNNFVDGEAFAKAASAATGYDVEVLAAGDSGELVNKLVLTKGAPIADAFYGVDNSFASRMIDNDVVEGVATEALPERAKAFAAEFESKNIEQGTVPLVPVDLGATCMNIDTGWFAKNGVKEPATFEDLADPAYKNLTVLLDPTGSSTGASFMIATIAKFGEDGYVDYWKSLEDNGARVVQGWTEAYNTEFSGVNPESDRPIVVSYSTSPAFTVNDDATESNTRALLDTCSTQVEYSGILKGAANSEGAQAVVDYLLSNEFQSQIAEQMYMYPIDESIELPEAWSRFAEMPAADRTHDLTSAKIQAGLDGWLRELSDVLGQ